MYQHRIILAACATLLYSVGISGFSQVSQTPLIAKTEGVIPNIVYLFDDSGSMSAQALYQYGGTAGGYGMTGPGNDVTTVPPPAPYGQSPDVNRIYYDPRITYSRRINADGTYMAQGTSPNNTFNVYFYNPQNTTVYSVSGVTVTNSGSGYPTTASGNITGYFNNAPINGTTAQATVNTTTSGAVNSATVGSGGNGYPTNTSVTFSAPPTGVRATGTVNLTNSGTVSSVSVTNLGDGYPSSGLTATFSAPQSTGITATGTPVVAARATVASMNVTNPGAGYPASGATITFGAPPTGGVRATGTVVVTPYFPVASATVTSPGTGYTSTPTIAFSAPPTVGGTTATGTAVMAFTKSVASTAVSAAGSGYTSAPTVSITGGGGSGATATATLGYTVASGAITAAGSNYTSTPSCTISGGGGSGASCTFTRNSTTKTITAITITSAGSGYTSTPTCASSGGSGSGATCTVALSATGSVKSITLGSAGSGYTSTPSLAISGGGGSGASGTATLTSSNTGGTLTGITITSAGSRYTTAPTITITGGGGSGAAATAVLSGTASYGISAINITNPGSGYTSTPTFSLSNIGSGSGASMSVVAGTSNVVTGITITNGGSGYSAAPTITLSTTPSNPAAFSLTMGTTRVVSSITITNPGWGYTTTPTCSITASSGSGATCSAVLGTTNIIDSITVTNPGSGYTSTPIFKINTTSGSGATFTVQTNSSLLAGINQKWNGAGSPTTTASYFGPTGYLPDSGSPLATNADTTVYYPVTASAATTKYPLFKNRTDCVSQTTYCTWTEELQNYRNWYTYHRTRLDMAKTGVGLAFQPLSATFRLGWARLDTAGVSNGTIDAGVQTYDSTTQQAFLTWLYGRAAVTSTPSRIAVNNIGRYFSRRDNNGPWADSPPACANCSSDPSTGTAVSTHATCRRSYAIYMTDGYYNDNYSGTTDVDSTAQTVHGYAYTPVGPYSDTKSGTKYNNSLADIAMNYWLNDLRPDLNDGLKTKTTDPATWQHMNFYAIGLGLVGTLDSSDSNTFQNLTGSSSRVLDWPVPASNSQTAIDDMWHATVNGRGLSLNVRNASELKDSIRQIIADVSGKEDSQSGVAVSTVSLSSETMKFTPWYTPGYWIGDVRAWHLDQTSANEICGPNPTTNNPCPAAWEVETLVSTDPITGIPTYTSLIPAESSRNIVVGNGAASGTRAVNFDYATLQSNGLTSVMGGTVNDALIKYLRGDETNEDIVGNANSGTAIYRGRVAKLGDIVNSTPTFVYQSTAVDYSNIPTVGTSFGTYKSTKGNRQEGMLFVGANDGMLHGFRNGKYSYDSQGNITAVTQAGGIETFAYVPRAILPTINKLADKAYSHRYYVDGPTAEADAYINGAWANIVLGSTGAGTGVDAVAGSKSPGTGIFAIDVTSLNSNTTSLGASSVLWEIGSQLPSGSDFAELGFMLSDIRTGPTLDGSWVAIFGNGYESKSCKAQLFIVNLANGALIKRIDTGVGNCSTAKNGLGGVTIVRNDKNQIIGAYAGDLQGNVWKFNLNDTNNANWSVDFGGDPLFAGGSTKPVTAPPTVISLSNADVWLDGYNTMDQTGYMVIAGSGKLYEATDVSTTAQQTLVGLWDKHDFGGSTTATGSARILQSELAQQTVGTGTLVSGTYQYATSANTVDYATQRGWYLDFSNSGERLIYPMDLLAAHYIAVTSVSPAGIAADVCASGSGGTGYFYVLDAISGAKPVEDALGITGINGIQTKLQGRTVSLSVTDATNYKYVILTPESNPIATITIKKPTPPAATTPVRKWRELFLR